MTIIEENDLFDFIESTPQRMRKQVEIIQDAIIRGISLADALLEENWTYDDLRYLDDHRPEFPKQKIYTLDDFSSKSNDIPVVSFFSGAGGLDLGFEAAGFGHSLLVEKIPLFCDTLRHNRSGWDVISGDVSNTEEMIEEIRTRIGKSKQFDEVFIGGPPCQPFSIAANQRYNKNGENFKRIGFSHETNGNLLFDYIDLIKHFKPRAFLIENVPGLMEIDDGEQLAKAIGDLEDAGYIVNDPTVLRADHYHVPQQRIRLFIIGSRTKKKFAPSVPTVAPLVCGNVFDLPLGSLENHITREHSAASIERYMKLPYGGRSHLHPYIPRTLSVRECARLQTFPDEYVFTGPMARQFTQVGNAVPPVLGAQLAMAIKKSYF